MSASLLKLVEEFKRLEQAKRKSGGLSPSDNARLETLRAILSERLHGDGPAERRQDLRVPAKNLRVRYHTGETFVNNYIHNLSHGGVFIFTPMPLPLNSRIKLYLVFEDEHREIEVEGIVVWESTLKQTLFHDITKPGMGVKFTKMSDEAREVIENLVHSTLTEQASRHDEDGQTAARPGAEKEEKGKDKKDKRRG